MHSDYGNDGIPDSLPGWQIEDFLDADQLSLAEDDPWADIPSSSDESETVGSSPTADVSGNSSRYEDIRTEQTDLPDIEIDLLFGEFEEYESEADAPAPFEGIDDPNVTIWDEPEPFAEYDSELSEDLYFPDDDVSDRSRKIKIDEFVAGVADLTFAQQGQVTELLETLRGCFQSIRHILTSTDETQDIPKRSDGRTMGTPVAVATSGKTRRQTTHR